MAAVASHVEKCLACQKIVAAYRQIDLLVSSACQPADDFADRVLAAVSHSASSSKFSRPQTSSSQPAPTVWRPPWQRLFQVAAALIFVTLAAAVLLRQGGAAGHSGETLAQQSEETSPIHIIHPELAPPIEVIAEGGQSENVEKADELHSGRRVQGHEMQTVGVEKNNERKPAPAAQVFLPVQVRHVWSVSDFQQSQKALEKWAVDSNLSVAWEAKEGKTRQLHGKIELEDGRLQDVVDKLHADGWKLLTAALPQPDNGEKIRFTGRKVAYNLVLVQAD